VVANLHDVSTLTPDDGVWSASSPGCFNSEEIGSILKVGGFHTPSGLCRIEKSLLPLRDIEQKFLVSLNCHYTDLPSCKFVRTI
jgi:hypothetical protein